MGVGLSNYVEDKLLHWLFKQVTFGTPHSALWVSLHNPEPDETGSNELSTAVGAYQRAQLNPDANAGDNTNWNAKAPGSPSTSQRITNKLDITFLPATANWNSGNPIGYWGLWDDDGSPPGNFLLSGPIGVSGVVVLNGNTLKFPGGSPGSLYFQVD